MVSLVTYAAIELDNDNQTTSSFRAAAAAH